MKKPSNAYYDFIERIKAHGERFPKKHGEWYRIQVLGKWITLDTWNGRIALVGERCEPSGRDVYGNVVCFYNDGKIPETLGFNFGEYYKEHPLMNFWRLHIPPAD
jgi:hypothetical protein